MEEVKMYKKGDLKILDKRCEDCFEIFKGEPEVDIIEKLRKLFGNNEEKYIKMILDDIKETFEEGGERYLNVDCYEHRHKLYDYRDDYKEYNCIDNPNTLYLEHSCNEWVIGDKEQIEVMIEDLKEALKLFNK